MAVDKNIFKVRGSVKEAKESKDFDLQRRITAGDAPNSRIMGYEDLAKDKVDFSRLLQTTLDRPGTKKGVRQLLQEDLEYMKARVRDMQSKYQANMTADKVVSLSNASDITRAKEEIHHSVFTRATGNTIRFITNSGPNSKKTRHYVDVEFPLLGAISGGKEKRKWALEIRKSPLLFDCDCERHTFWYRYIASIGGYATGRKETGYPKIRNPRLNGIACKHVIRVMTDISRSGIFLNQLIKLIEQRVKDDVKSPTTVNLTQKEIDDILKNKKNNTKIKSVEEATKHREKLAKSIVKKPSSTKPRKPRNVAAEVNALNAGQQAEMFKALASKFTPEQIKAMLGV